VGRRGLHTVFQSISSGAGGMTAELPRQGGVSRPYEPATFLYVGGFLRRGARAPWGPHGGAVRK